MKRKKVAGVGIKTVYGVQFYETWPEWRCLQWLYLFSPQMLKDPFWRPDIEGVPETRTIDGNPAPNPYTGTGRFIHTIELTRIFMPKAFEWHDWSELIVRSACENPYLAITGCGTSGKSTGIGLDAFWFWFANPLETAVIVVSTSLDSANKRIWKEISRFYMTFSRACGGYKHATIGSSPRPHISPYQDKDTRKPDKAHGMYVTALQKKSETAEEMEYIKGFHPRRIYLIADEFDSLREHGKALYDIFVTNLASGAKEAKFTALGNDPSLFNELGNVMQRYPGKPLTVNDKEWTSIHGFTCLRLDAWDSPNIKANGRWTGLIGQPDIDRIVEKKGENSVDAWIMLHGLHPPEGADSTVCSEGLFFKYHCFDSVVWLNVVTHCACMDPAYGGDGCVIRLFDFGLDTEGKMRVLWHEPVYFKIDAGAIDDPEEYQVARQAMQFCKSHNIPPENFIGDSTGTTGGAMAILRREWSPRVHECDFSGAATDRVISAENMKKAKDEYDRFVTELHFRFREYVEADVMRGLDKKTTSQFCSRRFELRARKYRLETKQEMKDRGLSSPDESDCTVTGVELLYRKGISSDIKTEVKTKGDEALQREIEEQDFDSGETYVEDFEVAEYYDD